MNITKYMKLTKQINELTVKIGKTKDKLFSMIEINCKNRDKGIDILQESTDKYKVVYNKKNKLEKQLSNLLKERINVNGWDDNCMKINEHLNV